MALRAVGLGESGAELVLGAADACRLALPDIVTGNRDNLAAIRAELRIPDFAARVVFER